MRQEGVYSPGTVLSRREHQVSILTRHSRLETDTVVWSPSGHVHYNMIILCQIYECDIRPHYVNNVILEIVNNIL